MRILFLACLAGLCGLAAGCGVNENNFAIRYAQAMCNATWDCEFEDMDLYEDKADCIDRSEDEVEDIVDFMEDMGCSLDYDLAGDCLRDFKNAECEDLQQGDYGDDTCDEMWVCEFPDTGWF